MDKRTRHYKLSRKVRIQWLSVLIVIIAVVYMAQPVQTPISPLGEPIIHAVEPTPEPVKQHSIRTQSCIDKHPYVASRIKEVLNDDYYAYDLICRESSYNPTIINKSSGACGLAQALPCSKMKCDLADVDCQLKWIGDYVDGRYGSFEQAINWHNDKNWY